MKTALCFIFVILTWKTWPQSLSWDFLPRYCCLSVDCSVMILWSFNCIILIYRLINRAIWIVRIAQARRILLDISLRKQFYLLKLISPLVTVLQVAVKRQIRCICVHDHIFRLFRGFRRQFLVWVSCFQMNIP